MGCLTIAGYTKGCDASYGGISKVFIIEKAGLDITGMTVTSGEISALSVLEGYSGYTYDFLKDNSNWTEPIVGDGIVASVHWTPNVNLVFRKMSNTLRNEIVELSKGDVVIMIKDRNDINWVLGTERGMQLVASGGGQSGSVLEELNGETLLFTGAESYKSYTMTEALWDNLVNGVALL